MKLLYTFRAWSLQPRFLHKTRGTLHVLFDDVNDEHVIYFDTTDPQTGQPARVTSIAKHVWFGMSPEECFAYPGPGREHCKYLFFGEVKPTMEDECVPSFELYGRLPVPPAGCTAKTTTAHARAGARVEV